MRSWFVAVFCFMMMVLASVPAGAQNNTASSEPSPSAPPPTYAPPPCEPDQYCPPPSGSPPPPCEPNQYCPPPSGSPPPPCPPDQYCPPPSGSPPPPCEPNQYCSPPPGGEPCTPETPCAPPSGSYPQPGTYNDPCHEKLYKVRAEMDALMRIMPDRMHAFQEEFQQARMTFGQSPHSQDEWRIFNEEWMAKGQTVSESSRAEWEQKMRAIVGECFDKLNMGQQMGGPGMGMPMPQFGPPPGGQDHFRDLPPPPPMGVGPAGGQPMLNAEAEKIRLECEEKARSIMPPPDGMRPGMGPGEPGMMGNGSQPMMPPMDEDKMHQMHELWRDCEKRIRAIFEQERMERRDASPDHGVRDDFGSLEMYFDEESGLMIVQGNFVALKGNPESQIMQDLTCDGPRYLDQLFANGLLAEFRPEETREGTALRIYDSSKMPVIAIHDNPRCVINVSPTAEIPSITLDLADHLDVETNAAGDWHFTDGDVDGLILLHGGEAVLEDGNMITLEGRATFLVKNQDRGSERLGERYDNAIDAKKIGAEIKIDFDDAIASDSTPLGDMETSVTGEKNKVMIVIDSEAGVGKTISMEFARNVFETDDLTIEVVGVDGNGTETVINAVEADSLSDVLEPGDDGADGVEYWIVEDKNGFHILISFAHFSEKRVTVESAGDVSGAIPGFETPLVLVGAALASIVLGRRRKA